MIDQRNRGRRAGFGHRGWASALLSMAVGLGTVPIESAQAGQYTSTIESTRRPLPPSSSGPPTLVGNLADFIARAAADYNEDKVYGALKETFATKVTQALVEASNRGHAGVLVEVKVVQTPTQSGHPMYSLVGSGVGITGTGMNADDVCFGGRCKSTIGPEPARGSSPAPGAGTFWVEPAADGSPGWIVKRMDLDELVSNAAVRRATIELERTNRRAVEIRAQDGYLRTLQRRVGEAAHRARLDTLQANLQDARKAVSQIERELASELRRQQKREQATKGLMLLKAGLDVATVVAMYEGAAGDKLLDASGKVPRTAAQAQAAADRLSQQSGRAVEQLHMQHRQLMDANGTVWGEIKQIGVEYKMDGNGPH